jgi:phospholipase/carboxylesterase
MADLLETLVIDPPEDPVGAVIWLHGLGADAHDFESVVPLLKLQQPLRFIFPNAPIRPVTINAGAEMRAWYDANPNDPTSGKDDIAVSSAAVAALVEQEQASGTPAEHITLAGFSQGGVIALELGLSYPHRLAGIMALSTYVHDHEHLIDRIGLANIDCPIFFAHGLHDPMIPITRAITAREALRTLNYQVQWHEYTMAHQVCPEEINDISQWLNSVYA